MAFTPIGLDDLVASADLQIRRDRKYLVHASTLADIVSSLLESDASVLTIDGRQRFRYESVYFDTPDLVSYFSSARRRPRRFKVRTRSYLDTAQCVLEVKTRDARGRTVKHRRPHDIANHRQLNADSHPFLAGIHETAGATGALQPVLTTAYRRTTLLVDRSSRVTIDVDLTWAAPDGCTVELASVALVETKTTGPPCAVDRALWHRGRRPVSISKYCTGLAALRPELPANKWHRILGRYFAEATEDRVRP